MLLYYAIIYSKIPDLFFHLFKGFTEFGLINLQPGSRYKVNVLATTPHGYNSEFAFTSFVTCKYTVTVQVVEVYIALAFVQNCKKKLVELYQKHQRPYVSTEAFAYNSCQQAV